MISKHFRVQQSGWVRSAVLPILIGAAVFCGLYWSQVLWSKSTQEKPEQSGSVDGFKEVHDACLKSAQESVKCEEKLNVCSKELNACLKETIKYQTEQIDRVLKRH